MVDIAATARAAADTPSQSVLGRSQARREFRVQPADDACLSAYERLCESAIHAPAQHPVWVRAWRDTVNRDAFVVFVERQGCLDAALALEVVQEGSFRVARFMGGKHANGNFIPTRDGAAALTSSEANDLACAIRAARPDVDIVIMERQNPRYGNTENPLAALGTIQSPNISLAVNLDGGFAATLSRSGGKRKRKKYRVQLRKFEENGGYRLIEATTAEEVDRLIAGFFVMKADRFRRKGIRDVFAAPEIRSFFRQIYVQALAETHPPFVLHAVEVGGELRAVNALSMQPDSVVCEFGSIVDDESNASPGYFLDYTNIEQACALGKKLYDFSVGDEPYKRSWCDVETWQFDVLLPLTARGRVAFALAVARAKVVGYVKSNERLWSFVKGLRQKSAGDPAESED